MKRPEEKEGMTLIDIIISLKIFFAELYKKKLLIIVMLIIGAVLGFLYSQNSKAKYVSTSTMMLENSHNNNGSMSGALALASQFGLMGGGGTSVINEDKLVEIINSESIIKTTLFKKALINSKTDLLANHYMDLFGYTEKFQKNDSLKDFRFLHTQENLTQLENRILKKFHNQITKDFLKVIKSKSGILNVKVTTTNEEFSNYFNQYLIETLTSFYVNRITDKGRTNVDMIQRRVDSVAGALKVAEYALARWKDANFQLVKAQGMMAEMDLRRNVEVNNSIYIEGIKQLEISKFTLMQDTPFLQVIDQPSLPIEPTGKISALKGVLVGIFLGAFFSIFYIFIKKKYSEILAQLSQ